MPSRARSKPGHGIRRTLEMSILRSCARRKKKKMEKEKKGGLVPEISRSGAREQII
ncbi:hypothetical protein ONS95_003488 [Cadophora gregata]|uniref:uncharacterized protein n=1 Tax=Cadophora gregata TaxID=51156 RepID=UPI0026DD1A00|nr:uncharacterized protein ONS95_003488 [Cadophora gregata]KAK0108697.1 hypothetical protein ONS95_003488 [Cadophora gregata]KAK0108712.1 hypothetical protein ONS96_002560 [Cadophora gregata f. sp. sojae]